MKKIAFLSLFFSVFLGSRVFAASADPDGLQIIDAHTHTVFQDPDQAKHSDIPIKTEKDYFDEMKASGVVGAVAHVLRNGEGDQDYRSKNVVHCYGLNTQFSLSRLEAGLKSKRYSCIKVYLGYVHKYAYDKSYAPAYRLAEKYQVPVVFHTGDTSSSDALLKYAHPLSIDEVAVKFPKVNFVIAHCGNPWIQSAAEVAYKNPNVYLDGSALVIGDLDKTSPEDLEEYTVKPLKWIFGYLQNPKKLMYGTDWPLTPMKQYIALFKKAIPKEHWQAVFHDNAAAVFHLKF